MATSDPPSRPQLAVSAVIFRDGKVLLVRRARLPGKGFYSLPGGRVEFGESLHAALAREVDEETGLKIDIVAQESLNCTRRNVAASTESDVRMPRPEFRLDSGG